MITRNPIFNYLECAAAHTPEASYPSKVRKMLEKVAQGDEKTQVELAKLLDGIKYFFQTSQSVGKIDGRVKVNTIPEAVTTLINLRLSVGVFYRPGKRAL